MLESALHKMEFVVTGGTNYAAHRASLSLDQLLCKPTQITISVTDACSARCTMCDIWKLQPRDELSAQEWINVLGQMRRWLGPFWLSITGGEPFQKPGIFDILSFCREQGISTKMSSNGMFLKPAHLDRVLQHGPDFLSLSVDSPDPEIHDRLRGVPGLHDRCGAAIRYLRERSSSLVLGIATVIMEDNVRDLPRLVEWAIDRGVDRVLFQPLQPNFAAGRRGPGWHEHNPHWVSDSRVLADVVDELLTMKRNGVSIWNSATQLNVFKEYFHDPSHHARPDECLVRYSTLNVDPRGNVNFCWTLSDSVGNVREQPIDQIWQSHRAAEVRGRMKHCRAPCMLNCYRNRSLGEMVQLARFFWERQSNGR